MLFITSDGFSIEVAAAGSLSFNVKNVSSDFRTSSENFSLYAFSITRQNSSCVGSVNSLMDFLGGNGVFV